MRKSDSNGNGSSPKLDALLKRRAQIDAKLAAIEQRQKGVKRKRRDRRLMLIGVAFDADMEAGNTAAPLVKEVLNRAITRAREREFLKEEGLL